MAIEESDEVKRRDKSKHNGGITRFFDPAHTTRDTITDTWTASFPISDDLINRGFILEMAEPDESGHFLVCRFKKRDDYVP